MRCMPIVKPWTFIFMEDFVTFQRQFEAVSWEKLNDFITFGHFFLSQSSSITEGVDWV